MRMEEVVESLHALYGQVYGRKDRLVECTGLPKCIVEMTVAYLPCGSNEEKVADIYRQCLEEEAHPLSASTWKATLVVGGHLLAGRNVLIQHLIRLRMKPLVNEDATTLTVLCGSPPRGDWKESDPADNNNHRHLLIREPQLDSCLVERYVKAQLHRLTKPDVNKFDHPHAWGCPRTAWDANDANDAAHDDDDDDDHDLDKHHIFLVLHGTGRIGDIECLWLLKFARILNIHLFINVQFPFELAGLYPSMTNFRELYVFGYTPFADSSYRQQVFDLWGKRINPNFASWNAWFLEQSSNQVWLLESDDHQQVLSSQRFDALPIDNNVTVF